MVDMKGRSIQQTKKKPEVVLNPDEIPWTDRIDTLSADGVLMRELLSLYPTLHPGNSFRIALEKRLFDPERVERILEGRDPGLADRLIRALPARLLSRSAKRLEALLKKDFGDLVNPAPALLATIDPARAADAYLTALNSSPVPPTRTLLEIARLLPDLPEEKARPLFERLAAFRVPELSFFLTRAGCRLGHPGVFDLLPFLATDKDVQNHLPWTFTGHGSCSTMASEKSLSGEDLARFLEPGAPLGEIERARETASFQEAMALLASCESRSFGSLAARRFLEAAPPAFLDEQESLATNLAIATTIHDFERESPDLGGLAPRNLVPFLDLYAGEIDHMPDAFFLPGSAEEYLRILEELLEEDPDAPALPVLVDLMGRLRHAASVPRLVALLEKNGDPGLTEQAEEALVAIGPESADYIVRHWNEFDSFQIVSAGAILAKIDSPAIVDFLCGHPELCQDDPSIWCPIALSQPDSRTLSVLLPLLRREDPEIDRTAFVLLSLFQSDHPELPNIRERITEFHSLMDPFVNKKQEAPRPFLRLPLTCELCGETNHYRVHRIIVGKGGEAPVVSEEFPCRSCGRFPLFEIAPNGIAAIAGESLRLLLGKRLGSEKQESILHTLNVRGPVEEGEILSLSTALRQTREALQKDPDNARMLHRMSNLMSALSRPRQSFEFTARAYAADPEALEIINNRILRLREADRDAEALLVVERALNFQSSWHFLSDTPNDQLRYFWNIADGLARDLGRPSFSGSEGVTLDLLKKKTGRNDPCPCGSGRKYKKCCL